MFAVRQVTWRRRAIVAVLAVLAGWGGIALVSAQGRAASPACPWMDAHKSPEQRAQMLIRAMSLSQKLQMTTFSNPPWFTHFGTAGQVDAIPSLCIPEINMSDEGSGVAGLQQGTTVFPSGIAQAAMWDPELSTQFGRALGREAFAKGINVMLGPGMDMARTAVGGRNFEDGGEDPYLTGQVRAAAIRGIQSTPVLAEAKHYVLNDQEHDRNTVDVHVGDRALHEIYLAPFEAAVKQGHVGSIMCSYNLAFGQHVCQNKQLLDGVLRDEWGFQGFVTSDWGATHSTAPSANAGLDLEMNAAPPQYYGSVLGKAISAGQVKLARLNTMLTHIFVPMFRYGLFDHPVVSQPNAYLDQADTPADRALAREISEQSTVPLKNNSHLLPLDGGSGRTIAVIGTAANPVGAAGSSGGGGSSHGTGLPSPVSPLEGVEALAQTRGDRVLYADGSAGADATAVAKAADVAIVVIADSESEGSDRTTLDARGPGLCVSVVCSGTNQDENKLVQTVAAANPNTVVVIDAGAPGQHALARERQVGARCLVSGGGERQRDCRSDLRHQRPIGASPADVPALVGADAYADTGPVPGSERPGDLLGGPLHRLSLLRRPPPDATVPVRLRPVLHDLSLLAPDGGPSRPRRHGHQHGAAGRRRRRPGLRRLPGEARRTPAPAEGLSEDVPRARPVAARHDRARSPGVLVVA